MIHFDIGLHFGIVFFVLKFTKLYTIYTYIFSQIIYIGQNTVRAITHRWWLPLDIEPHAMRWEVKWQTKKLVWMWKKSVWPNLAKFFFELMNSIFRCIGRRIFFSLLQISFWTRISFQNIPRTKTQCTFPKHHINERTSEM